MQGNIMEVKNVRCCDMAALVALINMLKVNLGSTPEIYNTLLAVLCDFDPSKHGSRDRTVRYIRLLVSDKVLANCLLMSLPLGGHELQNLTLNTGSLPDMKKAIRHKFLGMKLSVQAQQPRSGEQNDKPANLTDQSVTIIVTDQEETENNSGHNTGNRSLLQTPSQSSDHHRTGTTFGSDTRTSSSQSQCIITITKSSDSSLSKIANTSIQAGSTDCNIASSIVQSNQSVEPVKSGTGSQTNQSKMTVYSGSDYHKSSVEKCQTMTLQSHGAKGTVSVSQCYKPAIINQTSPCPVNIQDLSQIENTDIYSKPKARMPVATIPYQQYTNPFQGNTSYRPCLTGPMINPLFPWTPVHYLQGILPSYNLESIGHYTRLGSVSGVDNVSLDLSLPRTSSATAQTEPAKIKEIGKVPDGTRREAKRCASTTCIPTENEEPKQKVRRLSTEIPICQNAGSIQPNKRENLTSQRFPTSTTSSYLCLLESRDSKGESYPNSLKALQELTSRINPKPNSLPTGNFSEILQDPKLIAAEQDPKLIAAEGNLAITSSRNIENQNNFLTTMKSTKEKLVPANKDLTASEKSKINLPLTTACTQYHLALPAERVNVWPCNVQANSVSSHERQTLLEQTTTYSQAQSSSEAACHVASTWNHNSAISDSEKLSTVIIPQDMCQNSSISLSSFPVGQHIQLPDGKCSMSDFPALLAESNTQSSESFLSLNKDDPKVKKPDTLSCMSEINLQNSKTLVDHDQVSDIDYSVNSRSSLYLKRNTTFCSNQSAEKDGSRSAVPPDQLGNLERATDPQPNNKTCLIIETTTENGTEQVQFKLDKQSSASLLGELLKLKPVQNSLPCLQTDVHDVNNNNNNIFQRNMTVLNNDGVGIDGDVLLRNIASTHYGHTQTKNDSISEPNVPFSSLNVSPYLLGMLPDTTTFSDNYDDNNDDDDGAKEETYSDEEDEEEDDDDVFLHPIF